MILVLLLLAFLSSVFLTILFRHYAITRQILDVPNARSSHTVSTPRGGGAAIVVTFLMGLAVLTATGLLELNLALAIAGSAVVVAGVGFWDDHRNLSMKWRLVAHFFSAFWVIYWLNAIPSITVIEFDHLSGWVIFFLASVFLVWLLNLYNFMDGIDGIAASEAVFISAAIGYFAYLEGHQGLALLAVVLVMSASGFLVFNWPPARIFMGDVGSGFLGIVLGGLAFALALETQTAWHWLMLFGVFLVDATVTLIIRILHGERWYEAHCSHAYQKTARRLTSHFETSKGLVIERARARAHGVVSLMVLVINALWLLPLAYAAQYWQAWGVGFVFVGWLPLVLLALYLGAGKSELNA